MKKLAWAAWQRVIALAMLLAIAGCRDPIAPIAEGSFEAQLIACSDKEKHPTRRDADRCKADVRAEWLTNRDAGASE